MLRLRSFLPLIFFAFLGCDKDLNHAYSFSILVEGEPGEKIASAKLSAAGKPLATTDEGGRAQLSLRGHEGQSVAVSLQCPEGYRSPNEPLFITLRQIAGETLPEFSLHCEATTRSLVVAVRAENGPNLPIVYLGKELGRTDVSGAAHVMLTVPPHETVELMLDTSERPGLRPKSPSMRFSANHAGQIAVLNQKFTLPRKKAVVHRKVQRGPVRID